MAVAVDAGGQDVYRKSSQNHAREHLHPLARVHKRFNQADCIAHHQACVSGGLCLQTVGSKPDISGKLEGILLVVQLLLVAAVSWHPQRLTNLRHAHELFHGHDGQVYHQRLLGFR
jgi:hypothetical protein